MTIPPPLLEQLAADERPLQRALQPEQAAAGCSDGGEPLGEAAFRWQLVSDGAANVSQASFIALTLTLTPKLVSDWAANVGQASFIALNLTLTPKLVSDGAANVSQASAMPTLIPSCLPSYHLHTYPHTLMPTRCRI